MVASGGEEEEEEEVGALESLGAKAEARREAILDASQVVSMLSGKSGESRMKTSEVPRRPRTRADLRSSVLRMGPRPEALPVRGPGGEGLAGWSCAEGFGGIGDGEGVEGTYRYSNRGS